MRKLFLLPLLAFFITSTSAQQKNISGGLFFSSGVSWLKPVNPKEATSNGPGVSYKIGAELNNYIAENFAFCFALQYAKYSGNIYIDSVINFKTPELELAKLKYAEVHSKLEYLEFPLSFKGRTTVNRFTYFMKAGGHIGFRVSPPKATVTYVDTSGYRNELTDVLIKNEISFANFGYHLGGGIEYQLSGNTRLLLEFLYHGGFWPVSKIERIKPNGSDSTKPYIYLKDIGLKVGILF